MTVITITAVLNSILENEGKARHFDTLAEFIKFGRQIAGDGFATESEVKTMLEVREHGFEVVADYIEHGKVTIGDLTNAEKGLPEPVANEYIDRDFMATLNLTELESQFMAAFVNELYAEPGFSDVDANNVAEAAEMPIKIARGVVGSLVKKGLVYVDGSFDDICYLSEYKLHKVWATM